MLYDSPFWQWGPGICTKHRGQSLPCRVCIDGHDPDLVESVAQIINVETGSDKILSVENVTHEQVIAKIRQTFGSPEPTGGIRTADSFDKYNDAPIQSTGAMVVKPGAHYYEMEAKKRAWAAEVIGVIEKTVPIEELDLPRTKGIVLPGKTYFLGAWDNAKTWNGFIGELRKCIDNPIIDTQFEEKDIKVKAVIDYTPSKIRMSKETADMLLNKEKLGEAILGSLKPVTLTCIKNNQPPAQLMTGVSEGVHPVWSNVFMGRKAGSGIPTKPLLSNPMGTLQGMSADMDRPATSSEWHSGESVDLFFSLPLEVKGAVQDVRRSFPEVVHSVLVRAAYQTLEGRTIRFDVIPLGPPEREAVKMVCALTTIWRRNYYAKLQESRERQAADRHKADGGDRRPDDQGTSDQGAQPPS